MFTGIIEEVGEIKALQNIKNGRKFVVSGNRVLDDLKVEDSISINGVCQTVVEVQDKSFVVESVEETLRKTTMKTWLTGRTVNLERARKLNDRMGGHLVQGHIDCIGYLKEIERKAMETVFWFEFPKEFSNLLVPQGSIAIDGISLTVAGVRDNRFMTAIIPYTWENTAINLVAVSPFVNLEFDIIGKYVSRFLNQSANKNPDGSNSIYSEFYSQPDL